MKHPISPSVETQGLVYFARLCDKVRLKEDGGLAEDYHANLGGGMDLWTCQLLQVEYPDLAAEVRNGASDVEVLEWAFETGKRPSDLEITWWNSYMRNFGHCDHFAEKLAMRVKEGGFQEKEIYSFFDYFDADEERL